MAFTSRAPRELSVGSHATAPAVGPGSYLSDHEKKSRLSYAPFTSTSPRIYNDDANYTPGPGSYVAHEPILKNPMYKQNKPSSIFHSATERFSHKPAPGPGPGAYGGHAAWKVPKHRRPSTGPSSQWRPSEKPPSIPTPQQSGGYEEDHHGRLVLTRPQRVGHTGIGSDSLGPGEAMGNIGSSLSKKGTQWAKSGMGRSSTRVTEGPGPGQYGLPGSVRPQLGAGAQSSSFASTTVKSALVSKNDVPGVGTYSANNSTLKLKTNPNLRGGFGSSSEREASYLKDALSRGTPGVGTYSLARPSDEEDLQSEFLTAPHTSSAFRSNTKRFSDAHGSADEPGPGSYVGIKNASQELSKKIFSRNKSFGSRVPRFHSAKHQKEKIPGPGSYFRPSQDRPFSRQKPSSQFASGVRRFTSRFADTNVGPGSYSPQSSLNTTQGGGESAFKSHVPRFQASKSRREPGPGHYNVSVAPLQDPNHHAAASAFRSSAPRLAQAKVSDTPGPGSHSVPLYGTLIKRSFNFTVDNGGYY